MTKIGLVRMKCCGILEINGLSRCNGPLDALQGMHTVLKRGITWPPLVDHTGLPKGMPYPFLTFTGAFTPETKPRDNYAQNFADYITENNLGGLITVPAARKNWTGNLIQIWIWEPNYDNLWALLGPAPPFEPEPLPGVANAINQAGTGISEAQPVTGRLTSREA